MVPLIGSTRPPRRLNRALPDDLRSLINGSSSGTQGSIHNEEVITTARPSAVPESGARVDAPASAETGTSVVREWVNELTGRTERENAGIRVPNDAEITQLTGMFPDIDRQLVVGALQRRYVLSVRLIMIY